MILADSGIPWSVRANDLVGLVSQPRSLLTIWDYTDLRHLRLPSDQNPLRSGPDQWAGTVAQTPLSQKWEDKAVYRTLI